MKQHILVLFAGTGLAMNLACWEFPSPPTDGDTLRRSDFLSILIDNGRTPDERHEDLRSKLVSMGLSEEDVNFWVDFLAPTFQCPDDEQATLVVTNQFLRTQDLSLDGTFLGMVGPETTQTFTICPGSHTLRGCDAVRGCETDGFSVQADGTVEVTLDGFSF